MKPRAQPWLWCRAGWPDLRYDPATLVADLAEAHRMQGLVEGKAAAIGLHQGHPLALDALSDEVMATAAIEGERLPADAVRSSVMRRLGLGTSGPVDRHVDGLVEVVDDATTRFQEPLDEDRLCRWQSALFPGGTSGIRRIVVGRYRDHADPMQIVSGRPGKEVVHYEAPPSRQLRMEMKRFLAWFAKASPQDGLARAAIAHLWFETIHPFEDGNGRIGRAIVDMALSQYLGRPAHFYSLSRQLLASRSAYYDRLNEAQRGDVDVTPWVGWFVRQCIASCRTAGVVIDDALEKRRFRERHSGDVLNDRQRKVLERLLAAGDGGFEGGLNAAKYIKMTGASKATATRDLTAMVGAGVLRCHGAGKAARYYVDVPGWSHGLPPRSGARNEVQVE